MFFVNWFVALEDMHSSGAHCRPHPSAPGAALWTLRGHPGQGASQPDTHILPGTGDACYLNYPIFKCTLLLFCYYYYYYYYQFLMSVLICLILFTSEMALIEILKGLGSGCTSCEDHNGMHSHWSTVEAKKSHRAGEWTNFWPMTAFLS